MLASIVALDHMLAPVGAKFFAKDVSSRIIHFLRFYPAGKFDAESSSVSCKFDKFRNIAAMPKRGYTGCYYRYYFSQRLNRDIAGVLCGKLSNLDDFDALVGTRRWENGGSPIRNLALT
jgi:hypothetical protein